MARRSRRGPAVVDQRVAPDAAAPTDVGAGVITFSLETALWAALIGLAAALRLASLDHLPLTVSESARSFSAWLVSQDAVPEGWPGDITAAVTSYLFRLFGAGDVLARLFPAIAGSALVASFWLAAPYVGRGSALLAGVLVAFSPLAVHTSRSASAFALGAFLSIAMVVSLFAYLRGRQPLALFAFSASFGLALASDPVATSTAIAVVAFLAIEAAWRRSPALAEAFATFRSSSEHWLTAALMLAAMFMLGITHLGTQIDRLSLSGLRQWAAMFDLPRDGFPWHYQLGLLLGYEWPLLLAGGAAFLVLASRFLIRGGQALTLFQRFLLVWATVATMVVAFATRREAGQLLALLLPFSLLAGLVIEEATAGLDWSLLRRWWPAVVLALGLIAYALVLLSQWAREGGRISDGEKAYLVLAFIGAVFVLSAGFLYLRRRGLTLALPLAAALTLPFLVHSSLSIAFGDGTEFATDTRFSQRIGLFQEAVAQVAQEQGAPVVMDIELRDALGWYLRDTRIVFGDPPEGWPLVTRPRAVPPQGFTARGEPWRLAQGWYPADFEILPAWRWLAYRQPYGNLMNVDVQIFVPSP
ncbi:MAG: hypothetical protein ACE5IZ_06970 [Dehalococcoidia bacterium]